MIAGATEAQVGTANFVDPFLWTKLSDGMRDFMTRHRIARLADLVGTIDTSAREKQWVSS
jgi:dihydroorotate dehydrogenase